MKDDLKPGQTFRHIKRGTEYEIIGVGELQMSHDSLVDGSSMVIYRGANGQLWCREEGEFHDGRFERVNRPVADELRLEWRDGPPPKPWSKEWFIAETIYGDRVALTALPEEWSYDFKTADETYMKAANVKRWMQFPDSDYIAPAPPAPDQAQPVDDEALVERLRISKWLRDSWRTDMGDIELMDIADAIDNGEHLKND